MISGAGAIAAIRPLLTDKTQILLVTDGNIARLEAAKQIRAILEEEQRSVTLIDNVPPEPSHHDVSQLLSTLTERLGWSSGSAAVAFWMWPNCFLCCVTRSLRGWTPAGGHKTGGAHPFIADPGHRRNRIGSHAECHSGDPGAEHEGGHHLPGPAARLRRPAAGTDHQHARAHCLIDRD
jgi:hypothetical protein